MSRGTATKSRSRLWGSLFHIINWNELEGGISASKKNMKWNMLLFTYEVYYSLRIKRSSLSEKR